jgi:hypothetical protein
MRGMKKGGGLSPPPEADVWLSGWLALCMVAADPKRYQRLRATLGTGVAKDA